MRTFSKHLIAILLFLVFLHPLKAFSETDQKPFLVLNNPTNAGFGAVFSSVLGALHIYDQGGFAGIRVDLNSGIYLDPKHGPNWWNYFFQPINQGNHQAPPYVFSTQDTLALVNQGFLLSRERAFELIQKYVHIKPSIQQEVESFVQQHFQGFFIIGIHHRGTDKKLEAPIVPYETTLFNLNWWLSNLPKEVQVRIFVATDDQQFLDLMCQLYPNQIIYSPFIRSKDGQALHYSETAYANNYQKGKEALIDCLLLSKCNLLLFPASSAFSMAALKFNLHQMAIPLYPASP